MGKVVELVPFTEAYNNGMREVIEMLTSFKEQLFNEAIGLLMSGRWRKWSDEQPLGTIFNFREKEMLEAGDKTVNELLKLKEKVEELLGKMGRSDLEEKD